MMRQSKKNICTSCHAYFVVGERIKSPVMPDFPIKRESTSLVGVLAGLKAWALGGDGDARSTSLAAPSTQARLPAPQLTQLSNAARVRVVAPSSMQRDCFLTQMQPPQPQLLTASASAAHLLAAAAADKRREIIIASSTTATAATAATARLDNGPDIRSQSSAPISSLASQRPLARARLSAALIAAWEARQPPPQQLAVNDDIVVLDDSDDGEATSGVSDDLPAAPSEAAFVVDFLKAEATSEMSPTLRDSSFALQARARIAMAAAEATLAPRGAAASAAHLTSKLTPPSPVARAFLGRLLDGRRSTDEPICAGFSVQLRRRDFLVLAPGAWLKDEVCNWYLQLLGERHARAADAYEDLCAAAAAAGALPPPPPVQPSTLHIWSTFFYSKLTEDAREVNGAGERVVVERSYCFANVSRWTAKACVDVSACSMIIVPINHGNTHWVLAAVLPEERRIIYVDSMGGERSAGRVAATLGRWFDDECADKKLLAPGAGAGTPWVCSLPELSPRQLNTTDCGVFMLMAADWLAAGLGGWLSYRQEHMDRLRENIALSIVRRRVD